MILGIGIDIVQVSKYEREVFSPDPADYLRHHFALEETEIVEGRRTENKIPLYAARWAAKEALIKALNAPDLHRERLGIPHADFREIQILCDAHERPYVRLTGVVAREAEKRGAKKIHLSLSHDGDYATAVVLVEGD